MDVRVRCRNESPVITVGVKNLAATKKITPTAFTRQGVADGIFLIMRMLFTMSFYHKAGQSIRSNLEVMQRLHEAVRKKRPDSRRENPWILQHDNAPSHSLFLVRDFLAKHATTVLPQHPYSPDLAPADFFCFQSSN